MDPLIGPHTPQRSVNVTLIQKNAFNRIQVVGVPQKTRCCLPPFGHMVDTGIALRTYYLVELMTSVLSDGGRSSIHRYVN